MPHYCISGLLASCSPALRSWRGVANNLPYIRCENAAQVRGKNICCDWNAVPLKEPCLGAISFFLFSVAATFVVALASKSIQRWIR